MKRNEPQWKREAARKHCKERRERVWDRLTDIDRNNIDWDSIRWMRQSNIDESTIIGVVK